MGFRRLSRTVAFTLALGGILVACGGGSGGTSPSSPAPDLPGPTGSTSSAPSPSEMATVTMQLDWAPNTNHTGFYVADQLGYYEAAGIELEILPYSGANGDILVSEGQADFAVSFQNSITLARPAGVDITTVAAILQHNTDAIAVRADRDDIQTPADLDGKLYAGFGAPFELSLMKAFIQAAGGTGEFESVILDTAAYEAVYNGSADFVITFKTWEGIEAELSGEPVKYFDYVDYGLPDQYSVILVANPSWLSDNADVATRFLAATRKGYEYGVENPDEAAQILIDANPGVFTNEDLVLKSQQLMATDYFADADGTWGCVTAEQFSGYSSYLFDAGIVVDEDGNPLAEEPDWTTMFDMSYLGC